MKPFVNLDDLENFVETEEGSFKDKYSGISELIGARKLGYNLTILPPGKKACPFHNHRVNEEMFLILEGEGTLRFGDMEYSVKRNDIIACPPGDRSVAHQLINTGAVELKFLGLSTMEPFDICEYPDSNKVMSMVKNSGKVEFRHISKADQAVDYMEGEI